MKFKIITVLLLFITSSLQLLGQNVKNNLYLLIDKEDMLIESEKSDLTMKYYFENRENNWYLRLTHLYSDDNGYRNHYRYDLPNQMIDELQRNGNIIQTRTLTKKIGSLNIAKAKAFFRLHYSYYYDYVYKSRYRTYRRYNVFLIFKSDMDKKYVPCYEVSVIIGRIEQY